MRWCGGGEACGGVVGVSACGGVVGASACGASFWLSVIGGGVMLVRGGVMVRCGPEGASWCGVVWW